MSKIVKDLQALSPKELEQKVAELRKELVEQKRSLAAGELQNPHAITKTRRMIAVALTLTKRPTTADKAAKKEEA